MTKPASAAAAPGRPLPVIILRFRQPRPGFGGSLSRGAKRDRAPRRPPDARGSADPVDAGREPGEMAPRPYHLVLRAIPARRTLRGLRAVPPGLRLSVQFLLCQRRPAARPPPARPSDPSRRRRDHRLSPACRRRRGEILSRGRRGHARQAGAAGRSRPQSRAAASGIDADRHPARLRAKPDSAGLRSGLEVSRFNPDRRRMGHPQRGHPHRRARRRQLSFRQRKARAPRAGRPGEARPQPRHQRRMARLHEGRRLLDADAVADGRLCRRRQRGMAGARPLARRSTANGRS